MVVAGVADSEGTVFDGRETAFAFQSDGGVVRSPGVSVGVRANTPLKNAQNPRDIAASKNRIRARIGWASVSRLVADAF